MYKHLFGPVPSRRLGMSLGVDLVPKKVCSLDCVYCEVGKTTKLTTERKEYVKYDKVVAELEDYFVNNPDPDYITFSGYGEPTLNSRIGDVLAFIKEKKPNVPVAVLTNGTLFNDPEVRKDLLLADVVLPSLDAATDETLLKINRPAKGITVENYINGLKEFRKEFKNKLQLEVFILPEYNTNSNDLEKLKEAIQEIKPDSIQINTLDRPGTEAGLRAATKEEIAEINKYWALDNSELISAAKERKKIKSYRKDTESAILETIVRRPCTASDLSDILGIHINEVNKYLDVLAADKKIEAVEQDRGVFYQVSGK